MNKPGKADDLSDRAIRLARKIDRLTPGTYEIRLVKPDLDAASWHLEIFRQDFIEKTALSKVTDAALDTS